MKKRCKWLVTWEGKGKGGSRCAKTWTGATRLAHSLVGRSHIAETVSVWMPKEKGRGSRAYLCEKIPFQGKFRCRRGRGKTASRWTYVRT